MTLRIGMIGTGWFARKHAEMLSGMDGVRVQGIVGSTLEKAQALAASFDGAGAYGSIHDMLEAEKLDAAYICVPPMAHGEIERQLIERRIPFLIEKPLGLDVDLPRDILERVTASGLITSVGYHIRYQESSQHLRSVLQGRTIGMAAGGWMGSMPGVHWWRKQEGSGGQFIEQTTHIVDLLRYTAGEVVEVYAAFASRVMHERFEGVTVPDVGSVVLKLRSGAVATISNTCLLPGDAGSVSLSFYTEQGRVDWKGNEVHDIGNGCSSVFASSNDPYRLENEAFLHAVRTGDTSLIRSDYADAFRTQEVTYAATVSAASGVPVKLAT